MTQIRTTKPAELKLLLARVLGVSLMKNYRFLLAALLLVLPSALPARAHAAAELNVYPPVPGLAASEHYRVRVRSATDGGEWQSAFAWETTC
jgi:hypothetical protein